MSQWTLNERVCVCVCVRERILHALSSVCPRPGIRLWCAAITAAFHTGMLLLPTHTHITAVFTPSARCRDGLKPLAGKQEVVTTLAVKAGRGESYCFLPHQLFQKSEKLKRKDLKNSLTPGLQWKNADFRGKGQRYFLNLQLHRHIIIRWRWREKRGVINGENTSVRGGRHRERGGGLLMTIKRQKNNLPSKTLQTHTHMLTHMCVSWSQRMLGNYVNDAIVRCICPLSLRNDIFFPFKIC